MLLRVEAKGLYCAAGDFYIDPSRAVDRALITHAHADHARTGCRRYLCAERGEGLLRLRLGGGAAIESLPFGQTRNLDGVEVSFHPSGHILGAAQIRVAYRGEVWVVSGDYKLQPDPTADPFEAVACHTFISECTFGLPIYRWPDPTQVAQEMNDWWRANRRLGRHAFIYAYSLGKAQRVLAGLDRSLGPMYLHPAVFDLLPAYWDQGIHLPNVPRVSRDLLRKAKRGALVILPPGASDSKYSRGVGPISTAFASGWMAVRGVRRGRRIEKGFVLSDHADWNGLNEAILSTGAERVFLTHGQTAVLERWLREKGLDARPLPTSSNSKSDQGGSEQNPATS